LANIGGRQSDAWWHEKRKIAVLRRDNIAKAAALEVKTQALAAAAKKEASLRREVELASQMARNREAELKRRDAEVRDSLDRREATLKALQALQNTSSPEQ
jgi:hypothetical protein